nr:hypothetical protein [Tanacetum cinerariifolium]
MVDVPFQQENPIVQRTSLVDTVISMVTENSTLTPPPPTTQAQVTNVSEFDSSLMFEPRLSELEKKVENWRDLPRDIPIVRLEVVRGSNTLSWKSYQGDSSKLNLPDHRRRVQRETTRSQNHTYKSPSHRSGGHRPHGAPMRPPLRSYGHRPHGGSMRPYYRPAGHRPHGPLMNLRRPNMNCARPNRSFFIQAPSYETIPFLKSSVVKTQYRAPWVPTVNRKNPPVNRKFSTSRRNFPTANSTASRKFATGSIKNHTADMGRKGKAMGHFARECRAPRSQERGRKENYRQGPKAEEKTPKALMAIDGVGWDWSYMAN